MEDVGARARRKLFRPSDDLDGDTVQLDFDAAKAHAVSVLERSVAGRYIVIDELGRGGMGVVVRAYDPKLRREVALKCLRAGTVSASMRERLVREAYAMAKLNHPNVVSVHDLEEVDDQVILVMEYVAGTTLFKWLQDERPWQDVVEVFLQSGRGLKAAHGAGLLHRDFKPGNVLISETGEAKVTDFGLVRFEDFPSDGLSQSTQEARTSGESGLLTQDGSALGTPLYMAPEQHEGRTLTPAADQYAFCVSLWFGLTGSHPFEMRTFKEAGSLRERKLRGPPRWPQSSPPLPRPVIAAIMRGLSARPEDRWPSIQGLLEVLERSPTQSRQRRRVLAGTAAIATATAFGYWGWGPAGSERCSGAEQRLRGVWDDTRREQLASVFGARDEVYAPDAWKRAESVLDAYASRWRSMYVENCEATTVRGEQSSRVMDLRSACLSRARMELAAAVDVLSAGGRNSVRNAHEVTDQMLDLGRCEDVQSLLEGGERVADASRLVVSSVERSAARSRAMLYAGEYEAARRELAKARDELGDVDAGTVLVDLAKLEAELLEDTGEYEASARAWREAIRLAIRYDDRSNMADAAASLMHVLAHRLSRPREALEHRAWAEESAGDDPGKMGRVLNSLGSIHSAQGNHADAEAMHRKALAMRAKSPASTPLGEAGTRINLAVSLQDQGKYADAQEQYERAMEIKMGILGAKHPEIAAGRHNLASLFHERGMYEDAEQEYRAALELTRASLGPNHPNVGTIRMNLASLLDNRGRHAEAESEHRAALDTYRKALGPHHPLVAVSRYNLSDTLGSLGKHEEALAQLRQALSIFEIELGPTHVHTARATYNTAVTLLELERYPEAEEMFERAIGLYEEVFGASDPKLLFALSGMGELHILTERFDSAVEYLTRALELDVDDVGSRVPQWREMTGEARLNLARALWVSGAKEQARSEGHRARATLDGVASSKGLENREKVEAWLREHVEESG